MSTAPPLSLGERLAYIAGQNGMFSLLPMTEASVAAAKERYGVYIVGKGRINLCGVNEGNVDYLVNALKDVMAE